MVGEEEIKKEAIERAGNTIVRCPYCKEYHSVASGWYFSDDPNASRDGNKIDSQYITKQLKKYLEGEK